MGKISEWFDSSAGGVNSGCVCVYRYRSEGRDGDVRRAGS